MSEVGAIDAFSGLGSIFQLNTKRTSINPFASVDEMSDVSKTDAQESPFSNSEELIDAFNLYDPKNRIKILSLFSSSQKQEVTGLLGKEGLQMAMKLYDKEKLMNLLFGTSQQDISKVLMNVMPLEKAFQMIPEKALTKFIMSKELEKNNFIEAFANYSVADLAKLLGTLTGVPQRNKEKGAMIATLSKIPLDSLKPMLASTKQEQKVTLVSKMTGTNNDLFDLFPKSELLTPLDNVGKEETLKGFSGLDEDVMLGMVSGLPEEFMPLLLSMIPTEKLANALIEKYPDIIQKALAGQEDSGSSDNSSLLMMGLSSFGSNFSSS
jgi:Mg/Co/Ni transporter MgtE